jgi:hypothetical protein
MLDNNALPTEALSDRCQIIMLVVFGGMGEEQESKGVLFEVH